MTNDLYDTSTAPALEDEFWGEQAEWSALDRPARRQRGRFGDTLSRWFRDRFDTSVDTSAATEDGVLDNDDLLAIAALLGGGGPVVEATPATNRRWASDPFVMRVGAVLVVVAIAVPVLMGMAGGSGADESSTMTEVFAGLDVGDAARTLPVPTPDQAGLEAESPSVAVSTAPVASPVEVVASTVPASTAPAATVPAPIAAAAVATPACGNDYELASGDYWIRIADAADVSLADLLAVNGASVDTLLVPGGSICLPVGASTPAPPRTSAAKPAVASASPSRPVATAPATPPATTAPPAPPTTVAAQPARVAAAESVAIIRQIWPDDLEERAIQIAWRESNHLNYVSNYCCHGLFQIHWNAHRSWLSSIGVTSVGQLYDPVVNTRAALELYHRAGGWGPWGG